MLCRWWGAGGCEFPARAENPLFLICCLPVRADLWRRARACIYLLIYWLIFFNRPRRWNNKHAIFYASVKYSRAVRPRDGLFSRFITGLISSAQKTKARRAARAAGRWCLRHKTKHTINTDLQSIHWTGARWRTSLQQPYIITSYLISSPKSMMDVIQPRLSLCWEEDHLHFAHKCWWCWLSVEGITIICSRFKEVCNQCDESAQINQRLFLARSPRISQGNRHQDRSSLDALCRRLVHGFIFWF